MTKQEKLKKIWEQIEIIDTSSEGKAVARVEEMVVFVDGAVPGDIVDLKINRFKKSFGEAEVVRLIKASPDRIKANCEHFGTCGGCKWQHLDYAAQLRFKQKYVFDAMTRLAKISDPDILPILGSSATYFYRNKLDFTFSSKKWLTKEAITSGQQFNNRNGLGFHLPGLFDKVLDIEHCHLQADPSNQIRMAVKQFALEHDLPFFDIREKSGFFRNLMIRTASTGETMVLIAFYENRADDIEKVMQHLSVSFPQITSLLYVINPKANDTFGDLPIITYKGKDFIEEEMEGLRFRIGAKSFYQTNSAQAYELYKVARNFAALTGNEVVYDLYTGTGTIANFVARKAKQVIGVEYVEDAILDARINAETNNIHNTRFFAGDMKDIFTDSFVQEHGKPDVIITDPPRAGMHTDVCNVILKSGAPKVVYVSCNPATQARDLTLLMEKYKVKTIQPVDMFPQTHHVENVVLLQLK